MANGDMVSTDFSSKVSFKIMFAESIGQIHFIMPGPDWCLMFERRWSKELSRRVAQNLPKNWAAAGSQEVMEDCYNKLKDIFARFDLQNKPQNIFNGDEIGFQTDSA
ncbi:hypothetical protein NQ314_001840 [Rhamnusium bicolor]|uniref:Uncharacterized protein n=1 Tax=Rhamnusium bicolor TaxID=1586634 RepID=A0AAV8ZRQ5_9CUCU|nr:hypothetical protein NQ314_001840 [Rhamnusium bicolor]